jgi:hypothetical protein
MGPFIAWSQWSAVQMLAYGFFHHPARVGREIMVWGCAWAFGHDSIIAPPP